MDTTAQFPTERLPSENLADAAHKRGIRLLWVAAIMLVLVTAGRMIQVMPRHSQLDPASGVFSCLAYDFAHGEFYRPLYGGVGYGGTRYFPLHPACQAGLMRLGVPAMTAGYLIAICAAIMLTCGVFVLLRRSGVACEMAAPCAVFAFCSVSGQWAITTIRGDLLPAALNVWGLACAAEALEGSGRRRFSPLGPAVFFTLAFSGKMTTLFGAAGIFVALALARRWKDALAFALCMLAGLVVFFSLMGWVSHGGFWNTMRTCASSDADFDTFATAPVAMLVNAYRTDAGAIFFWLLAAAGALAAPPAAWRELPTIAMAFTAVVTLLIFGTPGTAINHLLDLHLIAIVFFVVQIARRRIPAQFGQVVLALAVLISLACSARAMRDRDGVDRLKRWNTTLATVRSAKSPVLFEIPTTAVIAGQRPYMTDPYMFSVLGIKKPEVAAEFLGRIDRAEFGAIVTIKDPGNPADRDWFDTAYFGKGFIEHVLAHYELLPRDKAGDYIYVPKSRSAVTAIDEKP